MNLQRAQALVPAGDGRPRRRAAGERRHAQGAQRHHRHRRALARDERARREGIPQPRRGLLPALRRPAVQGQARRGDRRRQLGRRGGHRSRRHRRRTSPCSSSTASCVPTRCCWRKLRSLPNVTHHRERADHRGHRRRREGEWPRLPGSRQRREQPPRTRGHVRADRPAAEHRLAQGHASTLSPRGEIVVDARGQTSVPGVFAAGDATTVPYKQIIIAMGEGAKAALARLRSPDAQLGPCRGCCSSVCVDTIPVVLPRHRRNRVACNRRARKRTCMSDVKTILTAEARLISYYGKLPSAGLVLCCRA